MENARGDREPKGHLLVYAVAAASYIGVGIFEKAILNWVTGPLWLLAVVALAHRLMRRKVSGPAEPAATPQVPPLDARRDAA
ncbi:MAG: hypothetical protein ABIS47_03100 [Acidimicrobiales bacterium]